MSDASGRTDGSAGAADPVPWHDVLRWIDDEVRFAVKRYRLRPDDREEMRQTLSVRIVAAVREFRPDEPGATLETFVRRHAGWGIADYWRSRLRTERRERPLEPARGDGTDADEPALPENESVTRRVLTGELRQALEHCMGRLSELQRSRLLATESALGSREPLPAVAASLGISTDTLKEAIARVRAALRRCLLAKGMAPLGWNALPPDPGVSPV